MSRTVHLATSCELVMLPCLLSQEKECNSMMQSFDLNANETIFIFEAGNYYQQI